MRAEASGTVHQTSAAQPTAGDAGLVPRVMLAAATAHEVAHQLPPGLTTTVVTAPELPGAVTTPALRYRVTKRVLDLLLASMLMVGLLPVFVIVWAVIRATTPGGALFRQTRVGRNTEPFGLFKFRTMYVGCTDEIHRAYVSKLLVEDEPPSGGRQGIYKLASDPRITRVGRFLRRTSIDELPQLLNVLRGEMSLVGPRPVLPWEAELFRDEHRQRFLVSPGVTGLWQVSGRNNMTMRQGLELDIEYVKRASLRLDLQILVKTIPAVLRTSGAL